MHDATWPAWDVSGQVFVEQATADIVVVADRMAYDQPHLPVAVEVLRRLGAGIRCNAASERERSGKQWHSRLHAGLLGSGVVSWHSGPRVDTSFVGQKNRAR